MVKYILGTGAPGSRWSGFLDETFYSRPDVDTSDQSPEREYWKGNTLMHRGAYFDPGMEFGNFPEDWDKPFSGNGYRLIKSHTFAFMLNYLTRQRNVEQIWMIHRPDNECYEWWHEAGGWDITYPNYRNYYFDNDGIRQQIKLQNQHILKFAKEKNLIPQHDGDRTIYRWNNQHEIG